MGAAALTIGTCNMNGIKGELGATQVIAQSPDIVQPLLEGGLPYPLIHGQAVV